jgi:hypothetical protein
MHSEQEKATRGKTGVPSASAHGNIYPAYQVQYPLTAVSYGIQGHVLMIQNSCACDRSFHSLRYHGGKQILLRIWT